MNLKIQYKELISEQIYDKLKAVKCDVVYTGAQGDHLETEINGKVVQILDLVGGFGSTFLGHNHPLLVAELTDYLEKGLPVFVQGSIKNQSTLLAAKLNSLAQKAFGNKYIVKFTNTGAESVEAALKHSVYAKKRRILDALKSNESFAPQPMFSLNENSLRENIRQSLPEFPNESDLFQSIQSHNRALLEREYSFLSHQGAYHGKSLASVNVTHNLEFREHFQILLAKTRFLSLENEPHGNKTYIEKSCILKISEVIDGIVSLESIPWTNIYAFLFEPIQGEGGIRPSSGKQISEMTNSKGRDFPIIADEIQSGMGRTGKWFASEHLQVNPDYIVLSKSLGGGICKIGAMLIKQNLYLKEFSLLQSSTFCEDDLSSAIALKTIEIIEKESQRALYEAAEKGRYLMKRLKSVERSFPEIIGGIRGLGLMVGIEFRVPDVGNSKFLRSIVSEDLFGYIISGLFLNKHLIRIFPTLSQPNVLRIEPSYNISYDHLDYFVEKLGIVCNDISQSFYKK